MVLEGICTMVQMLGVLVRPYKSGETFKEHLENLDLVLQHLQTGDL